MTPNNLYFRERERRILLTKRCSRRHSRATACRQLPVPDRPIQGEGQVAAQRERASDSIGAAWHWLHCSNLWKIIDETPTAKTAARWAKSCFEKSSKVTEDRDYKRPPRPRFSPRPDLLLHSMSMPSFGFDDIEDSTGLSSKGSSGRNVKAKQPSKTKFLTDAAWSVLDDLGL